MTKPDTLTALEGSWIREELCKCRAIGINPEAVKDLENLARRVAIMPTHVHSILNQVGVLEKLQSDARAALTKAKPGRRPKPKADG